MKRHYLTILEEHGPTWDTHEARLITDEELRQIMAILALKQVMREPGGL